MQDGSPDPTVEQAPSKAARRLTWLGFARILGTLALVFAVVLGVVSWRLLEGQSDAIIRDMLREARLYTTALTEFRASYTEEVIAQASSQGLSVSQHYETDPGTLPLPEALALGVAARLQSSGEITAAHLYSPSPFPGRRAESGLRDVFAADAWAQLSRDPSQDFYRVEKVNGRRVLRYAAGDFMRTSCVECHNNHPESPKRDWREGDLSGIVELDLPLGEREGAAQHEAYQTVLLLGIIFLLALVALGLVLAWYRQWIASLENEVEERTHGIQRARDRAERFRRILDRVGEAVFISDVRTGRFVGFNETAIALLGYTSEELASRGPADIQHDIAPQGIGKWGKPMGNTRSAEGSLRIEGSYRRKDGTTFPVEVLVGFEQFEKRQYRVAVARDVTERVRTEESRKRFTEGVLRGQEAERRRISHELHDGTGQWITSLVAGLTAVEMSTSEEATKSRVRELRRLSQVTLDDLRRVAQGLHPVVLDRMGFVAAVEQLAQDLTVATMRVEVLARGFDRYPHPSKLVELTLYRILQEGLANVTKHARATMVNVDLELTATSVRLLLEDDGVGFELELAETTGRGLGLLSMRERILLLGGMVRFETSPGEGTSIIVEVPLEAELRDGAN